MAMVRIEFYEGGIPAATISVPTWVVTGASRIIPKIAGKRLEERVDLDHIVELIRSPEASGTIFEMVDHTENDRIVISVVGNDRPASK